LQILHVVCEVDDFGWAKPNEPADILCVVDMIKLLFKGFNTTEDLSDIVDGCEPNST